MLNNRKYLAMLIPLALLFTIACDTAEEEPEQVQDEEIEQPGDPDDTSDEPTEVDGMSMETEEESYSSETEQLTVILTNNTDEDYYYGVEFRVDRNVDEEWEEVPFSEEMSFIQIAMDLPAGEQEEVIDLTLYEDNLEPGDYRVVKQVNGQELYAPFSIE